MLSHYVKESFIKLGINAVNWEDAIRQAAQPLLDAQMVTQEYVEDIVEGVYDVGPYFVLTKHIAVPHARAESGALGDAIGIASLNQPVNFGNQANDPVKYLFCLSVQGNQAHLEVLAQLVELFEDQSFFDLLDQKPSPEVIMKYLKVKE